MIISTSHIDNYLLLSSVQFKFVLYLYNSLLATTQILGQIGTGPMELFYFLHIKGWFTQLWGFVHAYVHTHGLAFFPRDMGAFIKCHGFKRLYEAKMVTSAQKKLSLTDLSHDQAGCSFTNFFFSKNAWIAYICK